MEQHCFYNLMCTCVILLVYVEALVISIQIKVPVLKAQRKQLSVNSMQPLELSVRGLNVC